eukprot:15342883-Ditylum_brightwellii.AAC.1
MGSYTDVLVGFANPQDIPEPATNPYTGKQQSYSSNPIRARKHMAVAIDVSKGTANITTDATSVSMPSTSLTTAAATSALPPANPPPDTPGVTTEEMA